MEKKLLTIISIYLWALIFATIMVVLQWFNCSWSYQLTKIGFLIWVQLCFSHDIWFILIDWILSLLFLGFKIDISFYLFVNGYNWWFDFILRKRRRERVLDFKIEILKRISSMITTLVSRLLCSSLSKIKDNEYMWIWINKENSKTLIFFRLFTSFYCFLSSLFLD